MRNSSHTVPSLSGPLENAQSQLKNQILPKSLPARPDPNTDGVIMRQIDLKSIKASVQHTVYFIRAEILTASPEILITFILVINIKCLDIPNKNIPWERYAQAEKTRQPDI